jgi:pimeloyl-ACP methyl ester carboxylesterase
VDEASSKFVDQLVLQRLVTEKLACVKHAPRVPLEALVVQPLATFVANEPPGPFGECWQGERIGLASPMDCEHPENRTIPVAVYRAARPRGNLLLVHGLYEDNRNIYGFLIGELNRLGYSVFLMTMPFHYERTPASSRFSGEYFFSADLGRSKAAFRQAALDVQHCHAWLTIREPLPTYAAGFSMGGTVALIVAGLTKILSGLCIINPAANLSEVMWTSPLCETIRRDLGAAGCDENGVRRVLTSFDPFHFESPSMDRRRILMIYGKYDQITSTGQYESLARRWAFPDVRRYNSGHLNTLRVPRLAEDMARFFDGLTAQNDSRAMEAGY